MIDLLLASHIEEAISKFEAYSNTQLLDELIPAEFAQKIPLKLPRNLSLADCSRELEFLRSINISVINQQFAGLDLEKLILIRDILVSRDNRYKAESGLSILS